MAFPYVNLPWLNIGPSDFLSALDRGTQAGIAREELAQKAAIANASLQADSRPQFRGGGGGGFSGGFDPLEQARTAALISETKLAEEAAAAKAAADAENRRLISLGVPADEAAAQSGWSQYLRPSSGSGSLPWQTLNLGGGEVAQVNKKTGESKIVLEQRAKPDPLKTDKLKSLRAELRGLQAGVGGVWNKERIALVLNDISALEQELGGGETPTASKAPETDPLGLFTK